MRWGVAAAPLACAARVPRRAASTHASLFGGPVAQDQARLLRGPHAATESGGQLCPQPPLYPRHHRGPTYPRRDDVTASTAPPFTRRPAHASARARWAGGVAASRATSAWRGYAADVTVEPSNLVEEVARLYPPLAPARGARAAVMAAAAAPPEAQYDWDCILLVRVAGSTTTPLSETSLSSSPPPPWLWPSVPFIDRSTDRVRERGALYGHCTHGAPPHPRTLPDTEHSVVSHHGAHLRLLQQLQQQQQQHCTRERRLRIRDYRRAIHVLFSVHGLTAGGALGDSGDAAAADSPDGLWTTPAAFEMYYCPPAAGAAAVARTPAADRALLARVRRVMGGAAERAGLSGTGPAHCAAFSTSVAAAAAGDDAGATAADFTPSRSCSAAASIQRIGCLVAIPGLPQPRANIRVPLSVPPLSPPHSVALELSGTVMSLNAYFRFLNPSYTGPPPRAEDRTGGARAEVAGGPPPTAAEPRATRSDSAFLFLPDWATAMTSDSSATAAAAPSKTKTKPIRRRKTNNNSSSSSARRRRTDSRRSDAAPSAPLPPAPVSHRNGCVLLDWRCVPVAVHLRHKFVREGLVAGGEAAPTTTTAAAATAAAASPTAEEELSRAVAASSVGVLLLLEEEWVYFAVLMHARNPTLAGRRTATADGDLAASYCLSYVTPPLRWLTEDLALVDGRGVGEGGTASACARRGGQPEDEDEGDDAVVGQRLRSTLPESILVFEEGDRFSWVKDDVFARFYGLSTGAGSPCSQHPPAHSCGSRGTRTGENAAGVASAADHVGGGSSDVPSRVFPQPVPPAQGRRVSAEAVGAAVEMDGGSGARWMTPAHDATASERGHRSKPAGAAARQATRMQERMLIHHYLLEQQHHLGAATAPTQQQTVGPTRRKRAAQRQRPTKGRRSRAGRSDTGESSQAAPGPGSSRGVEVANATHAPTRPASLCRAPNAFSVFPPSRYVLKNPAWRRKPPTLAMEMRYGRILKYALQPFPPPSYRTPTGTSDGA